MENSRQFDEKMMRRALRLAALGRGFASPNPMVGAVITDPEGRIVGEGWHRRYGGPHAEVNAVASARARGVDLKECTIYVTLEPCAHYGKTPPCALLLKECGFRRCVIGTRDPFPKVDGRGIDILRKAGMQVEVGLLEAECQALNRRFFFAHTHRRPWVELKWAESADGFMAALSPKGSARKYLPVQFSTPFTRLLLHKERAGFDAILAGTGTLLTDNPRLTCRLWPARRLRPVVLKSPRTPADALVLQNPDTIVIEGEPSLPELLSRLYSDFGITSLMVEGGPTLLASFLREGLYEQIRLETAPVNLGRGLPAPQASICKRDSQGREEM